MQSARSMGLNAIETYVPWNLHEPEPGKFVFSGILDLRAFLEVAHQVGLLVLLRPGPYICSEWDLGGLPSYLLRDESMVLRSRHPQFIASMRRYFAALALEILPYVGRPVVAIQIENEYGAYGDDGNYLQSIKTAWEELGLSNSNVMFFTSDNGGSSSVLNGSQFHSEDVLKAINLEKDVDGKIGMLRAIQPHAPSLVAEFWSGWFDHWGEQHHTRSIDDIVEQVRRVIFDWDASINLYVFFGGTNFGFMAGANLLPQHGGYLPDTTSYDYDGFLNEEGNVRLEKFRPMQSLLREFWKSVSDDREIKAATTSPLPSTTLSGYAGLVRLRESAPLLDLVDIVADSIVSCRYPLAMESVGGSYGYILYRYTVEEHVFNVSRASTIHIGPVRDFAYVIVDGNVEGTLDRNRERVQDGRSFKKIDLPTGARQIDILVENRGRINYGATSLHDRKGLLGNVTLAGKTLEGFSCIPISFASHHTLWPDATGRSTVQRVANALTARNDHPPLKSRTSAPTFFRGTLWIAPLARESFHNHVLPGTYIRVFGRGVLWVNGFNVGRFHTGVPGPQRSLYVPGALLKEGLNEFIVFHQNMYLVRGEPLLQMFAQADLGVPAVYDSRKS